MRSSHVGATLLGVVLMLVVPPVLAQASVGPSTSDGCSTHVVYRARRSGGITPIAFADATESWGATVPLTGMLAHAMATGDVNGDGWLDLFVGTFADRPEKDYAVRGAAGPSADQLLLGGPGGFTVDREFPGARGRTSGAVFVDLDGDGALDLVVARNVRDAPRGRAPSEVLRNLGDGKFERATTFDEPAGARAIGVLDFDADGRDDLFVLEDRWSGSSSVLLHNEGGFRFRDVTADRGLPLHLEGLGVSTADVTGDGRPDLFVSGSNRLFVATADGTFDGANSSVFAWQSHGSEDDPGGVAAGDLDGDGRIDLVVGQHFGSTTDQDRRVPVRVFMNHAGPTSDRPRFEELGARAGLDGLRSRAPHVEIADFDADGRPDILVGVATDAGVPLVYRNVGGVGSDLTFEAVAPQHGVEYWAAGVVADFDHDGRLDVALASFDASRPSVLVRNTASSGHWWAIAARAGAAVTLHDPSGNETRATVSGSTGFSSGPAPIAWFGLATATRGRATVQFADGTHAAVVLRSDTLVRLDC